MAQRLQSVADEGQIVVGLHVKDLIAETFNFAEVGVVPLKNKAKEMKIFEVLSER